MSEENFNEEVKGGKGMAIASMILGIVALIFSCIWYIGIPCAVVGLILGIMHNKKNTKSGMATAGIVCSIIAIALAVLIIILAIVGIAFFSASGLNMSNLTNY